MYSIILMNKTKIDITNEELPIVQAAINRREACIIIGPYSFAHHQFSTILPKEEADFQEKMDLRIKGFYRCRKYGSIHKLGSFCDCKETGESNPILTNGNNLLESPKLNT